MRPCRIAVVTLGRDAEDDGQDHEASRPIFRVVGGARSKDTLDRAPAETARPATSCTAWAYAIHCATAPPSPGTRTQLPSPSTAATRNQMCGTCPARPDHTPPTWLTPTLGDARAAQRELDRSRESRKARSSRPPVRSRPRARGGRRCTAECRSCGSSPIVASRGPRHRPPALSDSAPPLRAATNVIPSSGQHEELRGAEGEDERPHDRTSRPRTKAPNIAPMSELE